MTDQQFDDLGAEIDSAQARDTNHGMREAAACLWDDCKILRASLATERERSKGLEQDNARLREALLNCFPVLSYYGREKGEQGVNASPSSNFCRMAKAMAALALSQPAPSLSEHDDEVIEMVAKAVEALNTWSMPDMDGGMEECLPDGGTYLVRDDTVAAIRALKGGAS
jgi:hypothetical protein